MPAASMLAARSTGDMDSDDESDLPCFSLGTQEPAEIVKQPQRNPPQGPESVEEFVEDSQPDDSDFETPKPRRRPSLLRPELPNNDSKNTKRTASQTLPKPRSPQQQTFRHKRALESHHDAENVRPSLGRASPAPNVQPLGRSSGSAWAASSAKCETADGGISPPEGTSGRGKLLSKLRRASGSAEKEPANRRRTVAEHPAQQVEPLAARQSTGPGLDDGSTAAAWDHRGRSSSPASPSGELGSQIKSRQHMKRSVLLGYDDSSSDSDLSPSSRAWMDTRRHRIHKQQPVCEPSTRDTQEQRVRHHAKELGDVEREESSPGSDLVPAIRTSHGASQGTGPHRTLPAQSPKRTHQVPHIALLSPSGREGEPYQRPEQRRRRSQGLMAALGLEDDAGCAAADGCPTAGRAARGSPSIRGTDCRPSLQTHQSASGSCFRRRRSSHPPSVMASASLEEPRPPEPDGPSPGLAIPAPRSGNRKRRSTNLMAVLGLSEDLAVAAVADTPVGAGGCCSSDSGDSLPDLIQQKPPAQALPDTARANSCVLISDSDHSDGDGGRPSPAPPLSRRTEFIQCSTDEAGPSSNHNATVRLGVQMAASGHPSHVTSTDMRRLSLPPATTPSLGATACGPVVSGKPPRTPAGSRATLQQGMSNHPSSTTRQSSGAMLNLTPTRLLLSGGGEQMAQGPSPTEDSRRTARQREDDCTPETSRWMYPSHPSPPYGAAMQSGRALQDKLGSHALPATEEDADGIEDVSDSDGVLATGPSKWSTAGTVGPTDMVARTPESPAEGQGPPWWTKLEDFIPVAALKGGCDPRNKSTVHVDFLRQFSGESTPDGRKTAGGRSRSAGKRHAPAEAGQWVTRGDQRMYIKDGEEMSGQRGYKQWSKDPGKAAGAKTKRKPKKRWHKGRSWSGR